MDNQNYFHPSIEILEDRNVLNSCLPTSDCLQGWQDSATPYNIYFTINGQREIPPPGGILNVPPGATIGVHFTTNGNGTYSLGCYVAPGGISDLYNDGHQVFYGGLSISCGPGPHYLQLSAPNCNYFQIDFYKGCLTKVWDICALDNWMAGACIGGWWGCSGNNNQNNCGTCDYCQPDQCNQNFNWNTSQCCWQSLGQYFCNQNWQEELSCCHNDNNLFGTVAK